MNRKTTYGWTYVAVYHFVCAMRGQLHGIQWKLLQAGSITSTLFTIVCTLFPRCLHVVCTLFAIRVSEDALFAIHDWAQGIFPVTSYSGVKEDVVYISPQNWWSRKWVKLAGATDFSLLMDTHCLHNR